jgi:hypothetical protein
MLNLLPQVEKCSSPRAVTLHKLQKLILIPSSLLLNKSSHFFIDFLGRLPSHGNQLTRNQTGRNDIEVLPSRSQGPPSFKVSSRKVSLCSVAPSCSSQFHKIYRYSTTDAKIITYPSVASIQGVSQRCFRASPLSQHSYFLDKYVRSTAP